MKQKINPDGYIKPPAAYTNVIKVSSPQEMIFLAGVCPTDVEGRIVGEKDILTQAKQVAENIKLELKAAGAGPEHITMTTTYVLADQMDNFLMTGAASALFEALDNPADTLIGVASLAGMKYGQLLEVNVIAVIN